MSTFSAIWAVGLITAKGLMPIRLARRWRVEMKDDDGKGPMHVVDQDGGEFLVSESFWGRLPPAARHCCKR